MRTIIVKKINKYDPVIPGLSRYESYDLVARQKYSPGILDTSKHRSLFYDGVLSSSLKRGMETAVLYESKRPPLSLSELQEIEFSLKELLSETEYHVYGSNLVRQRFVEFFQEDRLLETRGEIRRRVLTLLKKIERLTNGTYLIISHSFFMKILDIYVHYGDLFEDPSLFGKYFNTRKKTYNFGDGFEFRL